jgi:hypothetical protein
MPRDVEIVDVPLPVFTHLIDGRHGETIAIAEFRLQIGSRICNTICNLKSAICNATRP